MLVIVLIKIRLYLVGFNFSLVRNICVPAPRVMLNFGKRDFFNDYALVGRRVGLKL